MVELANSGSEGKGHGLFCPACRIDLVMSERQGIEIDYCPKCRGVWLDRGELDKIIERSANAEAQAAPTQPHASQPAPQRAQSYPSGDRYYDKRDRGHGGHHGRGRKRSFLSDLFD